MAYKLPPIGSELRKSISVEQLVEYRANRQHWQGLQEAKRSALAYMQAEGKGFVRSVTMLVVTADGMLRLIEFGPRGGHRRRWTFGPVI